MDVQENINFEFTNFTPNESPMIEKKIIKNKMYPELKIYFMKK